MNLSKRTLVPELMDDPHLDIGKHNQALAGLRRINWWSGSGKQIASAIRQRFSAVSRLSVLDIGCGAGDVTSSVMTRLRRYYSSVDMLGVDISQTAINSATGKHAFTEVAGSALRFQQHDVFASLESLGRFDVVYCNLFLHHFSEELGWQLLKKMESLATQCVVVDDLVRSRTGYWLAQIGCRLLSRSEIVHFDGPQSVRAAYSIEEVSRLASNAGFSNFEISRHWPQRFQLVWSRL